jgi:cardiolipin synthase A/B
MSELLDQPLWLSFFAVIGFLSFSAGIISLFFALGRRPKRIWATSTPPVDSAEFLESITGVVNSPLQKGGTATLLDNGDAYIPAILDAIRGARHHVNFMVYIWEPGELSDRLIEAMLERARAGVEIRILLDAVGALRGPRDDFQRLEEAGGKIARFRRFVPGKLTRFHKRNHRRAIVIDGEIGFTGGAAVADKWLGDAQDPDHWRDSMVRVTGTVAADLQSAFAELWSNVTGEIMVGAPYYPSRQRRLGGTGGAADGDGGGVETSAQAGGPTDGKASEEADEGESVRYHTNLISAPSSEEHPLRLFFMLSFMAARERLYIATPYFVPDKHTRQLVEEKAKAGVDVRILMPNEHTDAKPIRYAAHSYYEELLEGGVRIFEYQPTMMHNKFAVIDGLWSIVGSANMDIRSKELNNENVIGILDPGFGRELEESFLRDLERSAEIRLEEWRGRGLWQRFLERLWVLFAEQY